LVHLLQNGFHRLKEGALKYYLIAGEASGDRHAADLMAAIKRNDAKSSFRFWGGDLMQAQGGNLVKHYKELAFMGFWEVAANIGTVLSNLSFCKKDILDFNPDVLILVDYPGFNLRIAKFAKKKAIKVAYYISPKVWAWKESRVKKIKANVDRLMLILPFEKDYYAQKGLDAHYVGNPTYEQVEKFLGDNPQPSLQFEKTVIALLPGSRAQELQRMLPVFSELAQAYNSFQFVIAGMNNLDKEVYAEYTQIKNVSIVFDQTYELMQVAEAAVVTSGTATLEIALFGVPQVVVYKAGKISYNIAKHFVKVDYISLVNLIMDGPVVTELIQYDFTLENLKKELDLLLLDEKHRARVKQYYKELKEKLGGATASDSAALVVQELSKVTMKMA